MPPILLAKRQKYEKSRVENTRDFKRFLLNRDNRNLFAVASHTLKLDGPVRKREQCIVRAAPDIDARWDGCAARANGDVAGQTNLTVSALRARRLDSESRPFLVEPTPFLCAIYKTPLLSFSIIVKP